jgi:hypothetical protein
MAAQAPDVDQFIQAVIAAANAAAAAAVPPNPPPPAPFALLPGSAFNAPLDYNKASELKIFRSATTGMTEKFALKEQHMRVFLGNLKEHARTYDWEGILLIPDLAGVQRNIVTQYGLLNAASITAHVITYIDTQTRNAQNSMMLYQYLLNSLAEESKLIMLTLDHQYIAGANELPSGPLFLKAIIGFASIDTKAKILSLREQVSNLHLTMVELKGNVRDFNLHASELKAALSGRGEQVSELITHLFKAYEAVPDQHFNRYIEGVRDRYDADIEDQTAEGLMQLAVNKFNLLEQRSAMQGDNTERVVALQATTATIPARSTNAGRGPRTGRNRVNEAWKKIPPKAGDPTTKLVNGRTYHYCIKHVAWVMHTPAECFIKDDETISTTPSAAVADRIVINRAYQAILHEESDGDD